MILFIPYSPTNTILKLISVGLLSAIKFFLAIPYSYAIGLSYYETLISTCTGGIIGFYFFYYLSGVILNFLVKKGILKRPGKKRKANKKIFSKKNKLIVKTKLSYGLIGLVILTPIILSIPIGAFILRKYYKNNKLAIPLMCSSIILCGFITTTILYFI